MAEGARIAEATGADIIDINMGCPARHVTGGQSGSALMRDLDHALTLIDATVAAVKVPVTLKMRLGWDDRSLNAPEPARLFQILFHDSFRVSRREGVQIEDDVFIGHNVSFINDKFPRGTNSDGALQTEADWEVVPTTVKRGA